MSTVTEYSPKIPLAEAEELALGHYEISAKAVQLAGEKDDNFRLVSESSSYFFKIVHAMESPAVTDLVTSVIEHLATASFGVELQRIIPTTYGDSELCFQSSEGSIRRARMTTFVEGRLLYTVRSSLTLREDLGRALAELTQALSTFRHPKVKRELIWDLTFADRLWPMLEELENVDDRTLLAQTLELFETRVKPRLSNLRSQTVHNDLSGDNVLVAASGRAVAGIIDFGDVIDTQVINDVAIAASNQLAVDSDYPFEPAIDFVRGYSRVTPLEHEELALIFDLVCTRITMHIIVTEWRSLRFPENRRYIMRKTKRAWSLLRALHATDGADTTSRLKIACEIE